MGKFVGLFHNYVLIAALLAWLVAQVCKTLLVLVTKKKFDAERLVGSGGMPSAHSATVCALSIAMARQVGVNSPEFAICIVLAAVVMYDAMGVRRSSGEQAKLLNKIITELHIDHNAEKTIQKKLTMFSKDNDCFAEDGEEDDEEIKQLKEKLGHTPLEVLAGALLGILIALIVPM